MKCMCKNLLNYFVPYDIVPFLQIINFYLKLISECQNDVQAFTSFFYTKLMIAGVDGVSHWMKDTPVNLLNKRLLLVPIHHGTHWYLATINFEHNEICYYDLLKGFNETCLNLLEDYVLSTFSHLQTNNKWSTIYPKNIPLQTNHSDCGVCILGSWLTDALSLFHNMI